MHIIVTMFTLISIFLFSENVYAQTPRLELHSITQTRLTAPTFVTNANDGTGRSFILEQGGRILLVGPNVSTATTFLDLSDRVLTGVERGLVGLAFHPQFSEESPVFRGLYAEV